MNISMVVTNVRMPQEDYLQVKAMAAELGISVNQYIHSVVVGSATQRMMRDTKRTRRVKHQSFYEAMLALALSVSKTKKKPLGLSEEDEVIYGI